MWYHDTGAHANKFLHHRQRRKRRPKATRDLMAPQAHFLRRLIRNVSQTEQTPPTRYSFPASISAFLFLATSSFSSFIVSSLNAEVSGSQLNGGRSSGISNFPKSFGIRLRSFVFLFLAVLSAR